MAGGNVLVALADSAGKCGARGLKRRHWGAKRLRAAGCNDLCGKADGLKSLHAGARPLLLLFSKVVRCWRYSLSAFTLTMMSLARLKRGQLDETSVRKENLEANDVRRLRG